MLLTNELTRRAGDFRDPFRLAYAELIVKDRDREDWWYPEGDLEVRLEPLEPALDGAHVVLAQAVEEVAVVRVRTGVEQPPRVGVGLARRELHAGQQRRHGVAAGERLDVGVGEVGAVVDAGRAELDRELDARALAQLVAVHAQLQPRLPPGLEHPARLLAVEGVRARRLAEDVDPPRVRGARAQHLSAHEVEVCRSPAGVDHFVANSLEVAGRLRGGTGLFGWIRTLPWGNPLVSSVLLGCLLLMLAFRSVVVPAKAIVRSYFGGNSSSSRSRSSWGSFHPVT